ncbi:MAG: polyphosphate kinase 1 [Cyclobacteriaceae bacterium]|nr:polyphosphate kinase 1 [Cyclobacteriaceae bacterium]
MVVTDRTISQIGKSNFISRDLSWLKFNQRVLDQAKKPELNFFEKLKFMAITSSNLDEFFMIRVGSLYNYLDYGKERVDYSTLREIPFKKKLFLEVREFFKEQSRHYLDEIRPNFKKNGFEILSYNELREGEQARVKDYFKKTIFPMLTPMVFDSYHTFPMLVNKLLIFGVVTIDHRDEIEKRRLSFIQIPTNLPRFFEIYRDDHIVFVTIEEVIRTFINKLFRNITIESANLFRITRNGDFTLDESDDIDVNFLEELRRKLKTRKTGRVVRIEIDENPNSWMVRVLKNRWDIEDENIYEVEPGNLFDYTAFWQIIKHSEFKNKVPKLHPPVKPISMLDIGSEETIFEVLKERDVLLHHPYNSVEPLLELLERSAEDPKVLSIKITIYRLSSESRVTAALLKAAENGKHVSVLFEVKARFDEENNLKEAKRLQEAGCFVIYGIQDVKTHTKLLLIVRKEGEKVTRYVHMSSGNYNETTAKLYTDWGILTSNEIYAHDVSEFFNAITGHSMPRIYKYLLTAPKDMRAQIVNLIRIETANAKKGLKSGVVIKINSLQDKETIRELYKASQAGVPVKLIVRGICSLRPQRKGLSENIQVISIVGEYLEHSRIYYFHNNGDPKIYGGSADVMVRSFDRRIESLFMVVDPLLKKQVMNILNYNLMDNVNAYVMKEDGTYEVRKFDSEPEFNIHKKFFTVTREEIDQVELV